MGKICCTPPTGFELLNMDDVSMCCWCWLCVTLFVLFVIKLDGVVGVVFAILLLNWLMINDVDEDDEDDEELFSSDLVQDVFVIADVDETLLECCDMLFELFCVDDEFVEFFLDIVVTGDEFIVELLFVTWTGWKSTNGDGQVWLFRLLLPLLFSLLLAVTDVDCCGCKCKFDAKIGVVGVLGFVREVWLLLLLWIVLEIWWCIIGVCWLFFRICWGWGE